MDEKKGELMRSEKELVESGIVQQQWSLSHDRDRFGSRVKRDREEAGEKATRAAA